MAVVYVLMSAAIVWSCVSSGLQSGRKILSSMKVHRLREVYLSHKCFCYESLLVGKKNKTVSQPIAHLQTTYSRGFGLKSSQ